MFGLFLIIFPPESDFCKHTFLRIFIYVVCLFVCVFVCLFVCSFVCSFVRLFVCLLVYWFVWSLSSHSRIFHSYGDVTIAGEVLQILTYSRRSRPLSSEGSLTCHTHCDTALAFIMVISEDP